MITWQTESGDKRGYLAVPEAGQGPGVLVLHAWWGLTDFFTDVCDQLAAAGFVTFAPDMFDGQTAQTADRAEQLAGSAESNFDALQALVASAVDFLREQPAVRGDKIGVIGFSFGAAWALLAATELTPAAIGATVLFYGSHSGLDRDDYAKSEAAFLGHFAEDDPFEEADSVRNSFAEMKKAGRESTLHFYPDTGHWFFEANQPQAHQPAAAELAWERTLAFLQEELR